MALPKTHRLKNAKDFEAAVRKTKATRAEKLLMRSRPRGGGKARIGIVISKAVDKRATARNRIRRLLSEAIAEDRLFLSLPYDLVFIALPGLELEDLKQAKALVSRIVKKASL